jgi:hypothetical protein
MSKRKDDEPSSAERLEKGLFEGLIDALADKHSQLDLNFQKTSFKLPSMQASVEVNGLITLTVHMRDLTAEEKQASAAKNVAMMATAR